MDAELYRRLIAEIERARPEEVEGDLLAAYVLTETFRGETIPGEELHDDDKTYVREMIARSEPWKNMHRELTEIAEAARNAYLETVSSPGMTGENIRRAERDAGRMADRGPQRDRRPRRRAVRVIVMSVAAFGVAAVAIFFITRAMEKPWHALAFSPSFSSPTRAFDDGRPELGEMKDALSTEDYARAIRIGEKLREGKTEGVERVQADQLLAEAYLQASQRTTFGLFPRTDTEMARKAIACAEEAATITGGIPRGQGEKDYSWEKCGMLEARAHILLDDFPAARVQLERVIGFDGPFRADATALLDKIKAR